MPKNLVVKQEEAAARREAYMKLSVQERVAKLDAAFGPGKGAARERARLAKTKEKKP